MESGFGVLSRASVEPRNVCGTDPKLAPNPTGHVALVRESDFLGDFGNRQVGVPQQGAGAFDPALDDIAMNGNACGLAE